MSRSKRNPVCVFRDGVVVKRVRTFEDAFTYVADRTGKQREFVCEETRTGAMADDTGAEWSIAVLVGCHGMG